MYMTIWSLTVCTIQLALVAMSPSGGKQQLCDWLTVPDCTTSDTSVVDGGATGPRFAFPGARDAAFFAAAYLASGIVGRLIARFAGRGAAVTSGAVFISAVWPTPVLPCSPLTCAPAGEATTADAANKAALATAHNRILNRFKSAIYLSSASFALSRQSSRMTGLVGQSTKG